MKLNGPITLPNKTDSAELRVKQDRQLREAAKMYEQHFLREMVRNMRNSVPEGGLVQTSFAEKVFREQLDAEYVDKWSERGGVGFAEMIYEHVKERYLKTPDGLGPPRGPLPLDRGFKIKGVNDGRSEKTEIRFEGQGQLPAESRQILSPWGGRLSMSFTDPQGHALVDIEHDNGLKSRLMFVGQALGPGAGPRVLAGQKLGWLDVEVPNLQWTISRV